MFSSALLAFGIPRFMSPVAFEMELFVTKGWKLLLFTKISVFYVARVRDPSLKIKDNIVFLQCLCFTDLVLFHHALTDNHLSFQSCCSDKYRYFHTAYVSTSRALLMQFSVANNSRS